MKILDAVLNLINRMIKSISAYLPSTKALSNFRADFLKQIIPYLRIFFGKHIIKYAQSSVDHMLTNLLSFPTNQDISLERRIYAAQRA